jgi:hypothetical protein
MKSLPKLFAFLSFAVLIPFAAKSQSFNGGLLCGGITSQVNGDGYSGYHQLGWTVGAYVNLPLGQYSSAQAELKYSLFGSHSDAKEVSVYGMNPYDLRLRYVEIPLMYQYRLGRFRVNEMKLDFITLEAGISLDFLTSFRDETCFSLNETAKWLFFSFTGNLGAHFHLNEKWGLGVRSMNSLMPIRRKANPSLVFGHYYNIVLQAVVTFRLQATK